MDNCTWGLIVSIILSAFFSAIEMAFVASNRIQFEIAKKKLVESSKKVSLFYDDSATFVTTLFIGFYLSVTLFVLQLSKVVDIQMASSHSWLATPLGKFIFLLLVSSFVIIIIGKFIPRSLVLINPVFVLKVFALPLYAFYILFKPISRLISFLSSAILHLFGIKDISRMSYKAFPEADVDNYVKRWINEVERSEDVDDEVKIFSNALDFSEVRVRDCCVPRTEIVAIDKDESLDTLKSLFIESGISKIIVIDGDIDNVIGYIHSSEMFRCNSQDWSGSVQTIPIVPETIPINKLLKILKQQHKSIAIVVDEFGGTSGVVTMEDIVEQIFGDIEDEHDTTNYICKKLANGDYVISARMEVEKVNEILDLSLPESDDYVTIGGLILERYQGFPKVNEEVRIDNFVFRIIKLSARKIELVKLHIDNDAC